MVNVLKFSVIVVISLFCFLLLLLSNAAYSQITISSDNLLGLIGKLQLVETDTTGSITIDVTSAGANQTWDFRFDIDSAFRSREFIEPAGTPFESDFPQSNLVLKLAQSSKAIWGDIEIEGDVFVYFEVTSSSFSTLGEGITISATDTALISRAKDIAPLPLTFDASWTSTETDTFGIWPSAFISIDTTMNTVDAWGTVKLPVGDFDCLRVRSDNKKIEQIIEGGIVILTDTTTNISYSWITQDNFVVASVESQNNEDDPNFTNAKKFQRLSTLVTLANDVGVSGFEMPSLTGVDIPTTVRVRITNFGSNVQTDIPVSYQINSETPVTENFFGTLESFQSITMSFSNPWIPPALGTYQVTAWTDLSSDQNSNNDTSQTTIQVSESIYAGEWNGTTSQDLPISFYVNTSDVVDSLKFDLRIVFRTFPSELSCVYTLYSETSIPIENDTFTIPVSTTSGVLYSTTVRGNFTSITSCEGTIDAFTAGGGICGGELIMGNIPVSEKTWNCTGIPLAVDNPVLKETPVNYMLFKNYPNPFNATTTITYHLPKTAHVKLLIFNVLGKQVETLVDNFQSAGIYSVQWDGEDDTGREVASGIYLYRLETKEFVQVKKLSLLR